MTRENADTKAQRALIEKRLLVKRVNRESGYIGAECRGDTGIVYSLGYDPREKRWGCTCEASAVYFRRCFHLRALQYVVAIPESARGAK